MAQKPDWVIDKERDRRSAASETVWLFGLHAVRDALVNPARERLRLVVTRNAHDKLAEAIAMAGMTPEMAEPRRFDVPIDPGSVHQGAALEVRPLNWGHFSAVCATGRPDPSAGGKPRLPTAHVPQTAAQHRATPERPDGPGVVVALDRVTDPHNVGAILRSAEVFGARAVIAPIHYSAPETGALAKAASGALERQPYFRVKNLADALQELRAMGFALIGLDGTATLTLAQGLAQAGTRPVVLVMGAEGPGLREKTIATCDLLVRIPFTGGFGSLNVSNAAAVALYAAADRA